MLKNFNFNPQTLKKCLAKAIPQSFKWIGVAFTVYTILKAAVPTLFAMHLSYLLCAWLVLFAGSFFYCLFKTYNHSIRILNSDNTINVHFQDICSFKKGAILIGIDDSLEWKDDNEIGHLHKQVKDTYGIEWMQKVFSEAGSTGGPYSIGYAFAAPSPNKNEKELEFVFLVVAKSKSQPHSSTEATRKYVYQAVSELFKNSQLPLQNLTKTLYTPILATGGNNLATEQSIIARDIACAFVCATQEHMQNAPQNMPIQKLHIVFRSERQSEIDMEDLNGKLEHCAEQCRGCPKS